MSNGSPNPVYPGPHDPVPAPSHGGVPPKPAPAKPPPLTEDQKMARIQRALGAYRHNMKHNAPRTPDEYKELQALLLGDKDEPKKKP